MFTSERGMHLSDAPSGHLLMLSLAWPSSLNPLNRPTLSAEERGWLTNFRCREARCFKPSDRVTVLAAVRSKFGTEEKFDHFVQTELLKVLERSKREYADKIMNVVEDAARMVFF